MQKCKYFEELGIKTENYGTNFISDDDPRQERWAKEREEYGFDSRECWNLDQTFIEWIYTRVKKYKQYACVNLDYHKIDYKCGEITQGQAIDKIMELAEEILVGNGVMNPSRSDEVRCENSREICDLWKEVLPCMWW